MSLKCFDINTNNIVPHWCWNCIDHSKPAACTYKYHFNEKLQYFKVVDGCLKKEVATVLPVLPFCLQDTLLSNNLDFHSSLASMFRLLLIETQTPAHDLLRAEWLFSFIGHTLLASLATLSVNDWFHLAEKSITSQWGSCWASGTANGRLFLHSWKLQRFLPSQQKTEPTRSPRLVELAAAS